MPGRRLRKRRRLQTLDELNEDSIGVGGDDASDALPKNLWLAGQKRDALLLQSRRGCLKIRDAKRDPV
jgi:hypothetical protein